MLLTLRIKKKYLLEIKSGIKKTEYRNDSDYYARIFTRPYTHLKLHYQNKHDVLIVAIVRIRRLKAPKHIAALPFITTDKVWAIDVKLI